MHTHRQTYRQTDIQTDIRTHTHMHASMYIYIYRDRERERGKERGGGIEGEMCLYTYACADTHMDMSACMYAYMCMRYTCIHAHTYTYYIYICTSIMHASLARLYMVGEQSGSAMKIVMITMMTVI